MSAPTKKRRRWIPRWLKVVLLVFLVPVIAYGVLAWRYWRNPPRPTRNYVAEYNAEIEKIPEDQRAWPRYREAYKKLEPILEDDDAEGATDDEQLEEGDFDDESRPRPIRRLSDLDPDRCEPGGPDWDNTVAYLRQHQDTLAEIRGAASLPHMGYVLSDVVAADDRWPPESDHSQQSENPSLMEVVYFPLTSLREVSQLLALDSLQAVETGDAERVSNNTNAITGLAHHLYELDGAIGDLSSLATFQIAIKTAIRPLEKSSIEYSDMQLNQLAGKFEGFLDHHPSPRADSDRLMFEDYIQRAYSENGDGDGWFHSESFNWSFDGRSRLPSLTDRLIAPLRAITSASRKEAVGAYDYILAAALVEYDKPFWESSFVEYDRRRTAIQSERGFDFILLFPPEAEAIHAQRETTVMMCDVALTAIALERFRRANGQWPQKLDELVPTYLATVPPDRFDGQPLRYRLIDGRPTLYSIGWDRVDQNGAAARYTSKVDASDRLCEGLGFSLRTPHDADEIPQGDWILWRGPAAAP